MPVTEIEDIAFFCTFVCVAGFSISHQFCYARQLLDKSHVVASGYHTFVNDDPQTEYGGVNSVVGTVYKISPNRAIMIFPTENNRVEIYELTK